MTRRSLTLLFTLVLVLLVSLADTQQRTAAAGSRSRVFENVAQQTATFPIQINFQDAATTPPSGYLADYGQAYDMRTAANQGGGAYTYGWINVNNGTPISLAGGGSLLAAGRNRNVPTPSGQPDARLATLMHMNHPTTASYNSGYWEIAVPNGQYTVTVAVGDPSVGSDPEVHRINAEGVNLINNFTPSGAAGSNTRHTTGSGTATVTDGKLTIDYAGGGVNTKINYVIINQVTGGGNDPYVTGSSPSNNATNVNRCTVFLDIAATVFIPVAGEAVDGATLTAQTVKLYRTSDQAEVPATRGTSGGGDVILLNPTVDLDANTQYTFEVTSGAKDIGGRSFLPYSINFTTGSQSCVISSDVEFEKINTGVTSGNYSSLVIGPDGKLYGAVNNGIIRRWNINADGTLSGEQTISSLQAANGSSPRLLIGAHFDPASTADNLILWVSHTTFGFSGMPDWGGKITRMSGANLENVQDYVINLPRSIRDHVTNGIDFGPDGALYFLQGSNSAMGSPDSAWGNRLEHLLTAAVLRLDPSQVTNPPLDVKTEEGGTYNPFAPNMPLTVYASGVRNAYDLVWHSNGSLYVPTNGSAAGGNTPATPVTLPAFCSNRIDGQPYTGGTVPGITNVTQTQPDPLFRIVQGGYYGHPNASRCEWVMNGGNPTNGTDLMQVNQYPVGTNPDPNWRGIAYNFLNNKSPNGVIEYQSNAFNGALQGKLMVVRYSGGDDIIVLTPNGTNGDISAEQVGIPGFTGFSDPLDLIEGPNGVIYVSEYAPGRITLVRPLSAPGGAPEININTSRLIFDQVTSAGLSAAKSVQISNSGNEDLIVDSIQITGVDGSQFAIANLPSFPLTIPPSGSTTLNITFDPTSNGPKTGVLQIVSNDFDEQLVQVTLRGLGENGAGGSNEPSLQWILDTWQIAVASGDTNAATNVIDLPGGATYNALIGAEVAAQAFTKAGVGNVTLELLAVYGPETSNPVTTVGWYPNSSTGTTNALFSAPNTPSGNGQSLTPVTTGVFSFDPGNASFGFYSQWPAFSNRVVYQQDALNTWETNGNQIHKVRVYPLPGASNAYVVAFEEHTTGNDYQDVVFIVRNVQPAGIQAPPSGNVRVVNQQWAGLNLTNNPGLGWLTTWMSFTNITNAAPNNGTNPLLVNDTGVLRIHNDSTTEPLTVTGLTLNNGDYTLPSAPALPATVAPGAFLDVTVEFVKNSGAKNIYPGTLTVVTSDEDTPQVVVQLRGAYMVTDEGGNEVNADQIADAFGLSTDSLGRNLLPLSSAYEARYEEVLSFRWKAANPSLPIYVRQLAAFHGCCNDQVNFSLINVQGGGNISGSSMTHAGSWGQSLLPLNTGGNPMQVSPTTSATFVIQASGYRTDRCESVINSTGSCLGHGMRLWPVYDPQGVRVPNTYFAIQDYVGAANSSGCGAGSANCDFNDNVYLITNIEPENAPFDLAASATGESADPVAIGDTVTYTFEVSNVSAYNSDASSFSVAVDGPGTLENLYLGDTPPDTGSSTPTVVARYNAGGPTIPATDGGPNWLADTSVVASGTNANNLPGDPYNNTHPLAGPEALYDTERSGATSTSNVGFNIPLPNGDYQVRLHFAEIWFTGQTGRGATSGNRAFHVTLEGTTVLTNYNPKTAAGAPLKTVVESFNVTVSDGTLNIVLVDTATDRPSINAIEIIGNAGAVNPCTSTSCPVGILQSGESQLITAVVNTTGAGTVTVTGTVTAAADTSASNNSDSETTTVYDPSALPGSITIVKEADPQSAQPFAFSGDLGAFELADSGSTTGNGTEININFQNAAAPVPTGYLRDFGQPYGARTDANQGSGLTYGWINPATSQPLDLSVGGTTPGNGRDRNQAGQTDQRLDTLMHMQGDDCCQGSAFNGTAVEGIWEIEVPNGSYEVTVAAGDPATNSDPEIHTINVEGVNAINAFVPSGAAGSATHHQTATVTVEVTDGRLTIDAFGGTNTKINYVDIVGLGEPNTITFTNVAVGTYNVAENVPANWALTSLVCDDSDGGTTISLATATATIDLDGGQNITCTFTNTSQVENLAAVAVDDTAATMPNTPVQIDVLANDSDSDGTIDPTTVAIVSAPTNGDATVNAATGVITYTPNSGYTGSDSFTYTVDDNDGATSNAATVTVTVSAVAPTCPPISTLPCGAVPVTLPYSLTWSGDEGGLDGSNGIGTGFTMVDPPSARLVADGTPTFADAPGYEPGKLTVNTANGTLVINTTPGIMYRHPAVSSNTNSQINGLGVGVDAGNGLIIETTVVNPPFNSSTGIGSQQGGIWFGLNENHYVKLVVAKISNETTGRVQLLVENYSGGSTGPLPLEINSTNITNITTQTITLRMVIDPVAGTATGYYSLNGTTFTQVTNATDQNLAVPAAFINGVDHDGNAATEPVSYAGLFATHRTATSAFNMAFGQFSIAALNVVNVAPVANDDTAATDVNAPVNINVLANDSDSDGTLVPASVTVVNPPSSGTAVANANGTITYTPSAGFTGVASFTYTVNDDDGATSNAATVTVTVGGSGTITIVKDARPDSTQSFDFTSDIPSAPSFSLTDSGSAFSQITWTGGANVPISTSEAQGVVVNGKLYVFGGFDSQKPCCTPTNRAYVYDPATNTWTAIAPMPVGLTHGGFTTDGVDIYYAGGYIWNAAQTGQIFGTTAVYRYDVSANTYHQLPSLPVARAAGALVYIDGYLHYMGGTNLARTTDTPEHWRINLANALAGTGTWQAMAPVPNATNHPGSAALNGYIYFIGGQKGHDGALVPQNSMQRYDPATNTWEQMTVMPVGMNHIHSAAVSFDGRIIVVGGQTNHGSMHNNIQAYDPDTNTWAQLTALPASRMGAVVGYIGGKLYVTTAGTTQIGTLVNLSLTDRASFALPEGSYNVSEVLPTGWALDQVICEGDLDFGSVISGNAVTIDLDDDEDIVCTFVNEPIPVEAGSITIVKDANPDDAQSFGFNSTIPGGETFSLTDSGAAAGDPININFQPETVSGNPVPVPGGYLPDYGDSFGARGNGLTYGWLNVDNEQAVDISIGGTTPGNGRDRNATSDQRYDTIMHMQSEDCCGATNTFNGTQIDSYWEIELPNGTYEVTVAVGDPNAANNTDPEIHTIYVEGVNAISLYTPTGAAGSATQHSTVTVTVTVSDGRLTVDAGEGQPDEGTNTKINFIDIVPLGSGQNSVTFSDVLAGSYTVTEQAVGGWSLADVVCVGDADGDSQLIAGGVNIDLDDGEHITCTFVNEPSATNTAPVAADDSAETTQDTPVNISVLANDSDADGTLVPASVTVVGAASNGTAVANADGTITYTPNAGYAGSDSFTYTVNDDDGATSNAATVSVTVNAVAAACPPISTLGCGLIPVSLPYALEWNGDEGGLDDGSGVGTGFTMVDPPSARLAVDGTPTFADAPGYEPSLLNVNTGTGVLQITTTKGIQFRHPVGTGSSPNTNSQINGLGVGVDASNGLIIETTVVNPPFNTSAGVQSQQGGIWFGLNENNYVKLVVSKISNETTGRIQLLVENYGSSSTGPQPLEINVDGIANVISQTITLRLVIDPVAGTATGYYSLNGTTFTQVTNTNNQSLAVPAAFIDGVDHDASPATDAVSYAGLFATHRNASTSFVLSFGRFSVNPLTVPNVAPLALMDTATTDADTAVEIDVLANDADTDGALVPASVTVVTAASNGTTAVNPATGAITYTPNAGFSGMDSFTYTVEDDDGALSNAAMVMVTVNPPPNVAPVAVDDTAATTQDTPVNINVLANDSDSDGTLVPASVTLVGAASNGTATANADGTITYTPNAGYVGSDSFTYTVNDDDGATSNAATVSETVNALPNVAPVAVDDTAATSQDTPVNINVLANDADSDGTLVPASIAFVSEATNGTVLFNANGTISYTPNAGFVGSDSFTYTVKDDDGATSNVATVSITVSGAATADLTVNFTVQGGHATHTMSIQVTLVNPSTNAIVLQQTVNSTGSASSGQFSLTGVTPGTYDLYIKGSNTLREVQNVVLAAGSNTVTFAAVRPGDANGDNLITLADYSILAFSFNTASGNAGYNAASDFNGDGFISLGDYSILAFNFNTQGAQLPTP